MNYRRIVHDYYYDTENNKKIKVSITYCPLTASPIVYKGEWKFSGLLYLNNDILYNKNNDLMIQILGIIISTKNKNKNIQKWSMIITPLKSIINDECDILHGAINDNINYLDNKYKSYNKTEKINYPVNNISSKYSQKRLVYVVDTDNTNTALVINNKNKNKKIDNINIKYNKNVNSYVFFNNNNNNIFITPMYWFAFHNLYNTDFVNKELNVVEL